MPCVGIVAVNLIVRSHRDLIQGGIAIGETIGHDEVEHIGGVESLDLVRIGLARLQLIGHLETLFPLREGDVEGAWLGMLHVEVDQQVVRAF